MWIEIDVEPDWIAGIGLDRAVEMGHHPYKTGRDPRSVIMARGRVVEMGTTVRDPEARVEIGRVAMSDDLTPVVSGCEVAVGLTCSCLDIAVSNVRLENVENQTRQQRVAGLKVLSLIKKFPNL